MWQLYRREKRQLATLQRQKAVITHSAHMQNELAAHGVTAHLLPYVVSTSNGDADSSPVKSCDILFAGRMDALKGGMLLLEAMPLIRRRLNRPLRVVFAGDGPDRHRWESRAVEAAHDDPGVEVAFTGWCDEERVGMLMRESRLLVVPSVWPEPFGSVGMAAARHGVPAAAFAVGGIPQWLHEGVNGHLASGSPPTAAGLADAVTRCLEEPRHYEGLSLGARQMADTFTMDRHLPELVRVLERVVDARR